jgi:hypothetical protein
MSNDINTVDLSTIITDVLNLIDKNKFVMIHKPDASVFGENKEEEARGEDG